MIRFYEACFLLLELGLTTHVVERIGFELDDATLMIREGEKIFDVYFLALVENGWKPSRKRKGVHKKNGSKCFMYADLDEIFVWKIECQWQIRLEKNRQFLYRICDDPLGLVGWREVPYSHWIAELREI